jgi:hypothetical protein
MILYFILFLILWTVVSVWWFFYNLPNKNKPGRWYQWIFAPPCLAIAFIVGKVIKFRSKLK